MQLEHGVVGTGRRAGSAERQVGDRRCGEHGKSARQLFGGEGGIEALKYSERRRRERDARHRQQLLLSEREHVAKITLDVQPTLPPEGRLEA